MIKSKAFRLVAVALAAGVLIGAAAGQAISRSDVQAMSVTEKNRQVRKDLLSILLPSNSLYNSNHRYLQLQVRASATQYRSLCQRDTLSIYYESIDRTGDARDWPALPYAISSKRAYRFVAPPKPEYLEQAAQAEVRRSPFDSECRNADQIRKDDEWSGWFTAESDEIAMDGGFAMLALMDWVKLPGSVFESCRKVANPKECTDRMDYSIKLDDIEGVQYCKAEKAGKQCVVLGKNGSIFTIHARDTGKPMQAADITSVDFEEMIIVT